MRIGIFGGTFDPIHYGHLLLAESCRDQCNLDQVCFVPAYVSPHKQDRKTSEAKHRVDMLRLAIGGHPNFEISDIEIERGGVSYTVDTLRTLRAQNPAAELFFLMGADSLVDFPTWREAAEICRLAQLLVVGRRHSPEPQFENLSPFLSPAQIAKTESEFYVEMPLIELSSTEIRDRVQRNASIRFRTPRAVEKYIESERLYR